MFPKNSFIISALILLILLTILFNLGSTSKEVTKLPLVQNQTAAVSDLVVIFNNTISSISQLLPISSQTQVAAIIDGIGSGLVGWWKLDEMSGTIATDSSGNNSNGTLVNGPMPIEGKLGQALDFSSTAMYINIPSNIVGTNPASVCLWLKIGSVGLGGSQVPFVYDAKFILKTASSNRFILNSDGGTNAISATNALPFNTWTHICGTRDASGVANLYANGVLTGAAKQNSGTPVLGQAYTRIGGNGAGQSTDGIIDDVRIYNRVLSASEISELYAYTGPSTPPSDTTSPSIPSNLGATAVSSSQINLSWTASTDDTGVSGYKIYRDGTQITTTPNTSYSNTGLTANTSYSYTVSAYDSSNNESAQSSSVSATTQQTQQDTTPPIISNIQATNITQISAVISWTTDESSDTQIDYGPTTSYGNSTTLNASLVTNHTQSLVNLTPNTTYHYRVRSKDGSNNLSQSGDQMFTTLTQAQSGNSFYIRDGAMGTTCTDWGINACDSLPVVLQRGATYYIADGNYPSYTFDDPVSGTQFITIKKATNTDHGTNIDWISTYGDGIAEWQPTIMFKTDYIIFDGSVGGGYGNWESNYGFKVSSQNDITFVMFSNKWGAPTDRVNVSHINISHTELVGRIPVSPGWGEGFEATAYLANISDINISYCYVHDIGGLPFKLQNATNITVDSCYIARNDSSPTHHGAGFRMDNVDGLTLRNSLFEDIVGTGFVGGYDTSVKNVFIYGNVFSWTPSFNGQGYGNGVIYSVGASGPIENWKIYNNSFIHLPYTAPIINFYNSVGGNEAYNNLFFDFIGNPSFNGVQAHDYNYYSTPGGTFSEMHSQDGGTVNPMVSWQTKDFRLSQTTQTGIPLPVQYNMDATGNIRGADGVWDIGAYEYPGTGTTPSPTNPQPSATADFNRDGKVNSLDFSLLQGSWNQSSTTYDLNHDNTVNTLDYSLLIQQWTG